VDRPNLLLIVIDSARADRFSCYGYDQPTTPNIDAVAEEGALFEEAWAESSWTLPMCFTLLTGLAPREHRAEAHRSLPDAIPTLQEALKGAGYQTYLGSGNQFIGARYGLTRGFDAHYMPPHVFRMTKPITKYLFRWLGWTDAGGGALTSRFVRHLSDMQEPWFSLIWYNDVHHPYSGRQPFTRRFCGGQVSLSRQVSLMRRMHHMQELGATASERDLRDISGLYDGALAYTDHLIGQLRRGLEARGCWENTVVVITADHGEMLGEKGLMSHGRPAGMYQPLIRVPMIMRAPGLLPKGAQSEALVQSADITHTLASVGGVGEALAPTAAEGVDLRAAAMGAGRPYALCEREGFPAHRLERAQRQNPSFDFGPHVTHMTAVIQDGWKLIYGASEGNELYSLRDDPEENVNLIQENRERAAELSRIILDWEERAQPHAATEGLNAEVDPEVQRRLEGLGYF